MAVTETILNPSEEDLLACEIADEALESAANTDDRTAGNFTQWICTAIYFCPGP